MVIGSVLLQPKKVPPATLPGGAALLDDALSLFIRVVWDAAEGGSAFEDILGGLEATVKGILDDKKDGLEAARQHVESWIAPLLARLGSVGSAHFGDSTAEEILASGGLLIGLLSDLAQNLTTDQVRDHLDQWLSVLSNDLGITNTALQTLIGTLFDQMANKVRQAPAGATVAVRDNRAQIASLLRRIKRHLPEAPVLPALTADVLAGPLLERMRKSKYDDVTTRAGKIGKAVEDGFTIAGTLLDIAPFSAGFGAHGPGAAESGTSHYMNPLAWYPMWLKGGEIHEGDDDANFPNIAFGPISKDTMEGVARHSRWSQYSLEFIVSNIAYFRKGNYANSVLQSLLSFVDLILPAANVWDVPWYANAPEALLFVVLGSLEGRSACGKFDGLVIPMRMLIKGLRKFWFAHAGRTLRDWLLSLLTLINHRSPQATQPAGAQRLNRNEFLGLAILHMELLNLMFAGLMPATWYSTEFTADMHPGAPLVLAWIAFALSAMLLGLLTGFLIGWAIAGEQPSMDIRPDWVFFLAALATFHVYWYFWNEGDTDGGKRGYFYPGAKDNISGAQELTFGGYQDPATSPYSLPYERGTSAECVQGNHGLWSHNAVGGRVQMFAYDFSLPYGTEILAMRSGTVIVSDDGVADGEKPDTSPNVNRIVIQHDGPFTDHDKDADGVAKQTYATYLHGALGSPIAKGPVKKGQVIMRVNSTGNSSFNHVHVDVSPDDGSGKNRLKDYTIPLVFNDVGGDGVPVSNHYYESLNTKI